MSIVPAAQVVYGNVELDRSPQHRGGFQTLFRTSSYLTDDEITQEIEPRLFFISPPAEQIKHVFFTTSRKHVVLGQVLSLTAKDEYGRTGLYFGHALVFSEEDFNRLDNDPFHVFDNFEFFNSVEQAMTKGGSELGDIPTAQVSLCKSTTRKTSEILSREQLLQLCIFAQRLLRSDVPTAAIGFYGEAGKTLEILRNLFSLIPVPSRIRCSFDTFFSGGTFSKTPYFAVGLTADQPQDPRFACFDVAQGAFISNIDGDPYSSYDLWLQWMLQPPLSDVARQADEAYRVLAFLEGQQISKDQLGKPNKDSLVVVRPILERRLGEQLKTKIGDMVGSRILPHVLSWVLEQDISVLRSLTQGFPEHQLDAWVLAAYEQNYEKPSAPELQQLDKVSLSNPRSLLRLIFLRWTQQWHLLKTTLKVVDITTSNRFKRWALATISARAQPILDAEHGLLLGVGIYAGHDQTGEESEVLATLLDISSEQLLVRKADTSADLQITPFVSPLNLQGVSMKHLIDLLSLLLPSVDEKA